MRRAGELLDDVVAVTSHAWWITAQEPYVGEFDNLGIGW